MWIGAECEGSTSLGEKTLFIRRVTPAFIQNPVALTNGGKIKRVWFCKEFTNYAALRTIAKHFDDVCVEITPKLYENTPPDILDSFHIYMKINYKLKDGDHVSIGSPYREETFKLGTGMKCVPEDYLADIKVDLRPDHAKN